MTIKPYAHSRVLHYAIFGPIMGLLLIDLGIIGTFIYEHINENSLQTSLLHSMVNSLMFFGLINLYGVFIAYVVGLLPAILTGLAVNIMRDRFQEAFIAMIAGAIPFLLIALFADHNAALALLWLAAVGALSGLVCSGFGAKRKAHTL